MATKESILADIDQAIGPDQMSTEEAINWIDELITELEMRQDGMRDDLRNRS